MANDFWSETASGIWTRRVGENEVFVKLAGDLGGEVGREHWAISSQAVFELKDVPGHEIASVLRGAWKRFRYVQPSIATRIVGGCMVYEIPSEKALEEWLAETFSVASERVTGDDCIATRRPSHWVTLQYLPHESKVVLQTPHWRSDGVGIFLMLDVFFDCVVQCAAGATESISWGLETSRLPPAVEEAAGLSHEQSLEMTAIAEECMATFGLVADNIGMKYQGDAATTPAGTRVNWIALDETQSSAIFNAAKAQDLTVTAVFHASVARANFHFARDDCETKPYVSTIRFGLRPYLPKRWAGRDCGSVCFTSGYMFAIEQGHTWSQDARALTAEYRKGYGHIMPAHREYAKMLVEVMKNMSPPDPDNLPSDMDVSSVGVVDRFLSPLRKVGGVELDVLKCTVGTELVTRQMVCFVWTFRDRLNLQAVYNEAYHTKEEVEKVMEFVVTTVMDSLGLDEMK